MSRRREMFELVDGYSQNNAVIKVIGIGGGGGNALEHMLTTSVEGVDFICANTDSQALKNSSAPTVLQLGNSVTKGLGAGANPEVGRQAALEDRDRIVEILQGADMVFLTAGMGGGTGTGAVRDRAVGEGNGRAYGRCRHEAVSVPNQRRGDRRGGYRGVTRACRFADHGSKRKTAQRARKRDFITRCLQGRQRCSLRCCSRHR